MNFKKTVQSALLMFSIGIAPALADTAKLDSIVMEDLAKGDGQAAKLAVNKAREEEQGKTDPNSQQDLDYLASFLEFNDGDYARALKILDSVNCGSDMRHEALLNYLRGKIYMSMRKFDDATKSFQAALFCTKNLSADDPVLEPVLEGLTGSLVAQKRYADAKEPCRKLIESTRTRYGELYGKCPYLWANLTLGDIYRQIGTPQEKLAQRNTGRSIINELMPLAYSLFKNASFSELSKIKEQFSAKYIDSMQPRTLGESLWLSAVFQMKTLPLIMLSEVKEGPVLLCVHGMGLENRAFRHFGRVMGERGVAVYAMDVRGFGSWLSNSGYEDLDYPRVLSDIAMIADVLQERHPGSKVFLLGESMGGAIALTAGSELTSIAGIVSSVPSAQRFQEGKMAVNVARHLVRGPNKQFNVLAQIAAQATSRPEMREVWALDPKARSTMSSADLICFDNFMRSTEGYCSKIKLPTFVVQGLQDKLVKPEGTMRLFNAVGCSDKTLLIIGDSEHLIFESDKHPKVLIDGLTTWLFEHSAPKVQEAPKTRDDSVP